MILEVFSNFNDSVIPRFSANRPPIKSLIQWLQQGLSPLFSTPGSLPAALQSANAIVTCTVQGGPWSLRGDTAGGKGRGAGGSRYVLSMLALMALAMVAVEPAAGWHRSSLLFFQA